MAGVPRSFLVLTQLTALLLALGSTAVAAPADVDRGPDVAVIVVLHDGADARTTAQEMERRHGGEVDFVYEHALAGFAGTFPEGRLDNIERDPRVAYVELDRLMHAVGTLTGTLPTGVDRVDADENTEIAIDGTDDRVQARVAVIDTGVDFEHPDLNVNTTLSVNCLHSSGGGPPWARDYYYCVTGEGDDDNGHGTHVGGTIGALDDGPNTADGTHVVGVAPGVELIAVKVLDSSGSGYTSGIVAGIDYVTSLNQDGDTANDVDVANMSLGGSGSPGAMEDAIANSVAAGVNYALAAGNSSKDVTDYTPAGQPDSLTVAALADYDGAAGGTASATCNDYGSDDTFATFSNFGNTSGDRVDIIAPGVCILSTVPGGGYDGTYSGTSMAAPHVAGAAALLAASGVAPVDIKSTLIAAADGVWDSSTDPDGSGDPLLDVSDSTLFNPALVAGGGDDGGTTNSPPTASFTSSCTDLTCDFDGSGSSDSDGSIASYEWDLGDGTTTTGVSVTHTYASGGDYIVTLTVTDDDGATDTSSQTVTVSEATTSTVDVAGVSHSTLSPGTTTIEVSGTGFEAGATVSFENGKGPNPEVSNVTVIDSTKISADVFVKSGGPSDHWDLRVTNPDNATDVLADAVYVQR